MDALAPGPLSAVDLDPQEWEALWLDARDHCLAPYLHKLWTDSGLISRVPPGIAERFLKAMLENAERNRRLLFVLDELRHALSKSCVPVLVSKGLPVAERCYGDAALRVLYDLDLLVPVGKSARSLEVLRELGYVSFFTNDRNGRQTLFWRPREYRWDAEGVSDPDRPCLVELHTAPWEARWHGFDLRCDLDLWEGAQAAQVGGVPMLVPRDERLLVHLAVHYACNVLESNARLMHLLDIIRLLRRRSGELDWREVLHEVRRSRAAPFCYIALELARLAGGCAPEQRTLRALRCQTPRSIVDWLDRRGIDDVLGMNLRRRDRALIHFLHWNVAAGLLEKSRVLAWSLRTPWREQNRVSRWRHMARRLGERLYYVSHVSTPGGVA